MLSMDRSVLVVALGFCLFGCSSANNRIAQSDSHREIAQDDLSVMVDESEHPGLDRWERIVDTPERWFRRKKKPSDGTVSEETIELVKEYLHANGTTGIRVTVNAYEPSEQWSRLKQNREIGLLWRLTLGNARQLGKTLLPDRVFDRNSFDPYTRTLAINSDRPVEILSAAAQAVYFEKQSATPLGLKPTQLPLLSEYYRLRASWNVIAFARSSGRWELEREGYLAFYPQVTSGGTMFAAPFVPFYAAPLFGIGGILVGHGVARVHIAARESQRSQEAELAEGDRSPLVDSRQIIPASMTVADPVDRVTNAAAEKRSTAE